MKSSGSSTHKTFRLIPLALALTSTMLCQEALSQTESAPPKAAQPKPIVLDEKAKAFGPEANPQEVFRKTKGRSALRSHGIEVKKLEGPQAGKAISSMPGAKTINRRQWRAMKEIPKTGLYLYDLNHIPPGLEEDLRRNGYKLTPEGTLTQNGKPVALFVHGETFRIRPPKSSSLLEQLLSPVAAAAESLRVSEARAASPFPWACGSWYFKWQYDGGFCRDYKAWSNAYAWGPGSDGGCADPKPLTHIQYISTYASIGGYSGWDYHFDSEQSHAYAEWDIGCFWPAFGTPSGFHYAYWRDGSAWMYRTWSW